MPTTGRSISWHGAILWDASDKKEGMLVWSYSPKWGHSYQNNVPHYMVGRNVGFVAR